MYPRDFGSITAGSGNTAHIGVLDNSLRINGYNYGALGLPKGLSSSEDECIFPNVNIETEFGTSIKTKSRIPIMTGALGSTFIAAKYWQPLAVGAALVGFPIVIGENVVGIDREAQIQNGRILKAPELNRRINTYLRYFDGYGAIDYSADERRGYAQRHCRIRY